MKKVAILTVFASLSITSFVFAQTVGDVNPDVPSDSCVNLSYNLKQGSRDINTNNEVSTLQDFLNPTYLASEPTGYFGKGTLAAVKAFQKANGLLSSGYVGPMTRAKIKDMTCGGIPQQTSVSVQPKMAADTVAVTAPTLIIAPGFVAQSVSPNVSGVKIGSFMIQAGPVGININSIRIALTVSGYPLNNLSNLSIKDGSTYLGTPVGYLATSPVSFVFPNIYLAQNSMKTFDVYADIGGGQGSVTANMEVSYVPANDSVTYTISAGGVPVTSVGVSGFSVSLAPSSAVSQTVTGGSQFEIAKYTIKTVPTGSSAAISELQFRTTGQDAIAYVTVAGMSSAIDSLGTVTVPGLFITTNSAGIDVPVTVRFNTFQGNTIPGVSLILTAVKTSGGIQSPTNVSSNMMTLVAPTLNPTIDTLNANPASISSTETSVLSWSTSNTTSCLLDGVAVSTSGSKSVSGGNHTLTCTGAGGSATKSILIPVYIVDPVVCATGFTLVNGTCSPTLIPKSNTAKPIGYLENVTSDLVGSCGKTSGWSFDQDKPDQAVEVHLYVDGQAGAITPEAGTAGPVLSFNAGMTTLDRPDVNKYYSITGKHGFAFYLPPTISAGSHKLYAYGININNLGQPEGDNVPINNSPLSFTCSGPVHASSFQVNTPSIRSLEQAYSQTNSQLVNLSAPASIVMAAPATELVNFSGLSRGANEERVSKLKAVLNQISPSVSAGCANLSTTNTLYGPTTEECVKVFQTLNKISPTGAIDEQTNRALNAVITR